MFRLNLTEFYIVAMKWKLKVHGYLHHSSGPHRLRNRKYYMTCGLYDPMEQHLLTPGTFLSKSESNHTSNKLHFKQRQLQNINKPINKSFTFHCAAQGTTVQYMTKCMEVKKLKFQEGSVGL